MANKTAVDFPVAARFVTGARTISEADITAEMRFLMHAPAAGA